ncbi:NAD(P)-dependent oxidoreductase [Streptomyces sp. NPDC050535]|uniref:NAD(P)-dependent oxidoreductase n=1 Tax=Streptomyces sp. NPDC050535 TaxID=3365626 RepID=UPI00378A94A8
MRLTEWPSEVGAELGAETDALLAGWKDDLDGPYLNWLPSLRYIGLRATSTDRVDLDYTRRNSITVSPIYGYGDVGTVEFVVEQMFKHVRHGEGRTTPGELAGRRLGLFGYGAVGQRVAAVASVVGMDVVFHTPTPRTVSDGVAQWLPLPELLSTVDILSFHSPAYREVVTEADLKTVSPNALVIITTLGLPLAESSLQAWQSGRTGRLVMDLCAAHALSASTPHIPGVEVVQRYAARTTESVKRAEGQLLEGLAAYLRA